MRSHLDSTSAHWASPSVTAGHVADQRVHVVQGPGEMEGWDDAAPAATPAEGSANPFAAPAAEATSGDGQAAPATNMEPDQSAAAPESAAAPVEPIDPELFSGPPVADSYAPAGTGVHGLAAQPGASATAMKCQQHRAVTDSVSVGTRNQAVRSDWELV